MWNINAPQGRIPCAIFTKFAATPFQYALAVNISLDLLKGLRSYGGFKLTVCGICHGYPQRFQRPLAAKLCVRPKKFYRCPFREGESWVPV